MKILSQKELDRPIKKIMRFECWNCSCNFEADNSEYKKYELDDRETWYECRCPNCSFTSYAHDDDELNLYRFL